MANLYFYGTLRHVPLLEIVLGHSVDATALIPAILPEFQAYWAQGEAFPLLAEAPGEAAPGLIATGLSDEDIARLDYYEGGFGYDLRPVVAKTNQGSEDVLVWWSCGGQWARGAVWELAEWQAKWASVNCRAAAEMMGYYGRKTPEEVVAMYPMIQARAASWVMAQNETPVLSLSGLGREAVTQVTLERPYAEYFAVETHELKFRRFDGSDSEVVRRSAFVSTDAALVLPYDPVRDRVLLIEQFRMGPWARGDHSPWQLEPIAGRVDAGESPEACARREALEEAGLALSRLELISGSYPTPGCSNEFFHNFIGLADLPDTIVGVGGEQSEQEDIRSHLISFDDLMLMLETQKLRILPLVMAVLWLARHRERLRAGS